jgi:hypothetical protein
VDTKEHYEIAKGKLWAYLKAEAAEHGRIKSPRLAFTNADALGVKRADAGQMILDVEDGKPHFEGWMNQEQCEEETNSDDSEFWNNPEEWLVPGEGFGIGVNKSAQRVYAKLEAAGKFFLRGDSVVKIESVDGSTKIKLVRPHEFRGIIENHFKVRRVVKGKEENTVKKIHSVCSIETATSILENESRMMLPKIERVVDCPIIDQKGNICREGYHAHLNGGTSITGGEAEIVPLEHAIDSVCELFAEYKFATSADRLRAIAMLLTTAISQGGLISGPFPIDVAEADESQSGKTFRHKVAAAVYNETLAPIAKQKGGVGSIDEAFASVLLSGRPFIQIDNLRGKLDSQLIEAAITSEVASVRVPYRGNIELSTKGVTIFITSNGIELTNDLANRCSIIRIRKRQGYQFKRFNEGDLLDHVQANQGYYLGCVFAILREWIRQDKPTEYDQRHSFRKWSSALTWITGRFLRVEGSESLMLDGHTDIQKRVSNPFETTLRAIAIDLRDEDRLEEGFKANELVDIAENGIGIALSGRDESAKVQTFGRQIGALFKREQAEKIRVEEFVIERQTMANAHREQVKYYRFTESE